MGGDFVVYVSVMRVVRVRIASDVNDRRPRNIYRRWAEDLLKGGQVHACQCPECRIRVEGLFGVAYGWQDPGTLMGSSRGKT